MVMQELPERRPTYLLKRGDYQQPTAARSCRLRCRAHTRQPAGGGAPAIASAWRGGSSRRITR